MERSIIQLVITTVFMLAVVVVRLDAQELLGQEALFRRCYAHLTQLRPRLEDPLLAEVRAGAKSALQACREVFNRALLSASGGTKIQDDNDAVAKAVLHTFNELHRTWAREQSIFNPSDSNTRLGTETHFEDSPMGPYITRALFSPTYNVDSVTQGTDFLQPVRTDMSPPHTYSGVPNSQSGSESDWRLGAQHAFAPRGDILGVRSISIAPITFFPPVRFTNLNAMPDFPNIGPPAISQSITQINFPDLDSVNGPLSEVDLFAVRIQGELQVTIAGSYTLYLNVDDGASLILNGERVIDRTSSGEGSVALNLSAGSHRITIEYRQRVSTAKLVFSWQGPGIAKQPVPAAALSGLVANYYTGAQTPDLKLTGHEGGGFLGSYNYLLTTFQEGTTNFVPNGALVTNRSYGRAVFYDALCRDIPVVRESDVTAFVIPDSAIPFRQSAACVACHKSLDGGVSGIIRGLRWNILTSLGQESPLPDLYGTLLVNMNAPSLGEDKTWTDIPSNDYGKHAPYGRLFFRNYQGQLVDREIRSIEELGAAIRAQDDYYACFAKRYYFYFTGINVELGDPGDITYPQLNVAEAYHRAKVIEYGNRLKTSKSLPQLVFDIMGSEEYRMTDYGISFQGTN